MIRSAYLFLAPILFFMGQAAVAQDIQITGSVQFWQRSCTADYRCEIPVSAGDRIPVLEIISAPVPGTSLSSKTMTFVQGDFAGTLSVFWKKSGTGSFIAGQSFLQKEGVRIAECSHYASDDVPTFIPVGFCAGYVPGNGPITQYGMTFYK